MSWNLRRLYSDSLAIDRIGGQLFCEFSVGTDPFLDLQNSGENQTGCVTDRTRGMVFGKEFGNSIPVNASKIVEQILLLRCVMASHFLYPLFNIGVQYYRSIQKVRYIMQQLNYQKIMIFGDYPGPLKMLGYFCSFRPKFLGYFFHKTDSKSQNNRRFSMNFGLLSQYASHKTLQSNGLKY